MNVATLTLITSIWAILRQNTMIFMPRRIAARTAFPEPPLNKAMVLGVKWWKIYS